MLNAVNYIAQWAIKNGKTTFNQGSPEAQGVFREALFAAADVLSDKDSVTDSEEAAGALEVWLERTAESPLHSGAERAGYLQSFLFRAERLIVDTGLNHKRWTREQAIEHMVATTGFARGRVQREIERYCASPGQACSYKIGHIAWLRARRKAQQALGPKFDLREFHDILSEGAMPLTILERRVDERVKAALRR